MTSRSDASAALPTAAQFRERSWQWFKRPQPDQWIDEAQEALRSLPASIGEDARQEASIELLGMIERGDVIRNPKALVRTIARRREKDAARKRGREVLVADVSDELATTLDEPVPLADVQAAVRDCARKEAEARNWPARWWVIVRDHAKDCPCCSGIGLSDRCETVTISSAAYAALEAAFNRPLPDRVLVPLVCTLCEGTGRGGLAERAAPHQLAREARAARERRARKSEDEKAFEKLFAQRLEFIERTPVQKIVLGICAAAWASEERAPARRDLAHALLLAGWWPETDILLDGTVYVHVVECAADAAAKTHAWAAALPGSGVVRPFANET